MSFLCKKLWLILRRIHDIKSFWYLLMVDAGVSVKQIQELDRIAIKKYGVPSLALMENAGAQVSREALKILGKKKNVLIVCGVGNNAGDGFVAARHMINQGINVKVWLIGNAIKLREDAKINYLILKKSGCPIIRGGCSHRDIRKSDLVVDAIFGVGLNRTIGDPVRSSIEAINKHARKILSVDIPSGLDGTTGKIYGVCIKATKTVTFSFPKKGFLISEGPRMTGKVIVVDIGIPKKLKERIVQ